MRSIEHVKRYTTTGMATDQGKTSNLNALAIAARPWAKRCPEVGLTTFRQPYTPVTFGAFAGASRGELFDPGAQDADPWLGRRSKGASSRMSACGNGPTVLSPPRRGHARRRGTRVPPPVRRRRLFDASTLGKIEVTGPDAAQFLDRIYTNPVSGWRWAAAAMG
jgi:sarcosine oxidase subunit alpha